MKKETYEATMKEQSKMNPKSPMQKLLEGCGSEWIQGAYRVTCGDLYGGGTKINLCPSCKSAKDERIKCYKEEVLKENERESKVLLKIKEIEKQDIEIIKKINATIVLEWILKDLEENIIHLKSEIKLGEGGGE